jgi:cyclopropane fatty-acyl-phospholipid synthase-like methyltransferase
MTIPGPGDFDAMYAGTPPWDIGRPQKAFLQLAESGVLKGRVLDVGCGTGEHALMAAALGLETTGVDLAPTAIAKAMEKASERGLEVDFVVADVLKLPDLGGKFDTVIDCGVFHVFDDESRVPFVASLASCMQEGGRYYMLCFSDQQPGDLGPRRVSQDEIRASFETSGDWRIESIEPSRLETTMYADGAYAWLADIERL